MPGKCHRLKWGLGLLIGTPILFAVSISSAAANAPVSSCNSLLAARTKPGVLSDAEHWENTGLKYSYLLESGLIDPEACKSNRFARERCVVALDALAGAGKPERALWPLSIVAERGSNILKVERRYGSLALVQLVPGGRSVKGRSSEEILTNLRNGSTQFRKAIGFLPDPEKIDYLEILNQITKLIDSPGQEAIHTATAVNAVLGLYDSHARITPIKKHLEQMSVDGDKTLAGTGMLLKAVGERFVIDGLVEGGPASKAGVLPGDVVVSVNGTDVGGMELNRILELLSGPVGSEVAIGFERGGHKTDATMTRELIKFKNVEARIVENPMGEKVGQIVLRSFGNENACRDVQSAIKDLRGKGAKKLILDLRGNPGGFLDESRCVAGLFLGREIVSAKRAIDGGEFTLIETGQRQVTSAPLVVLVNSDSASGSEFVAGALRDYHRGWILGERTFGKGTVQYGSPADDPDLKKAKILIYHTMERFYQPSGRSNQLTGIKPNFEVFSRPEIKKEEFSIREENLVLNPIPGDGAPWEEDRPEEYEFLQDCMAKEGIAKQRYATLYGQSRAADFQLLSAVDLLNCIR